MLLEKMKKGVGKVVITILAVLLIISFAVWGIGDMVTPGWQYQPGRRGRRHGDNAA